MAMRRVVVFGAVLILVAVGIVVAVYGADEKTRLRVNVSGLPAAVRAKVTVAGPDRRSYDVTGTDERDVGPGVYTVAIDGVHSGRATHYPVEDRYQVAVVAGRTTVASAAYRVEIPDSTKVMRPGTDIVRVAGERVYVRADSVQAERLAPGHHLVAGEGPGVPHMLVRRVESVAREGDQVVVETAPARLDEALPAGLVQIKKAPIGVFQPVAHSGKRDPLLEMDFSFNARSRACAEDEESHPSSISSKISYRLDDVDLSFDGSDIEWDVVPPWNAWASVTAAATLSMDHSFTTDIEAVLKCEVDADRDIRMGCASLVGHIARVGPITFRCDFKVVGSASVETSATWHTGRIKARTVAGLEFGYHTKNGFHADPTLEADLIGARPEAPEHESSFGANVGLHLGLKGEDAAGIAELSLGFRVTAGPKVTSTLTDFRGELEIKPKLVAEANLGKGPIKVGEEFEARLPGHTTTLWEMSRPSALPSPTPTTSSPTPTPTRSPPTPSPGRIDAFFVSAWDTGGGNCCYAKIDADGAGLFTTRFGGSGSAHTMNVSLRPRAGELVGTVTRYRRDSEAPKLGIAVGSPVVVKRDGRYTVKVYANGRDFGFFCRIDTEPKTRCAD
ncbi:hypothetical protein [Spirillospora sp. CA-294931]|uniref:hypothetical protein n=1 Tax=Spirillospora sp. CA-294931 TaxID=3240042 RepID=UPI003D908CD7